MKQTPMQELIEYIEEYQPKNKVSDGIWSKAMSLLEKEKQVIIDSVKWYMNTEGMINEDELAEDYYNETFKQK